MSKIGCSERELAVQTLADFERDGLGHYLDNADADVLRAMVRLCAERHRRVVNALREYGTHKATCGWLGVSDTRRCRCGLIETLERLGLGGR